MHNDSSDNDANVISIIMIKYIPVNQVDSPVISNIVRSIPTAVSFDIASSSGQQSSVVYEIAYYTKGEASFDEVRFNYYT